VLFFTVTLVPSVARADQHEILLAQGLFDDGLRLMDAEDYLNACPKFAESQRIAPAGGTILNLARCHEKQGLLASAAAEYDLALAQALKDRRTDRETFSRERALELAPRVPHLVLRSQESGELRLQLDASTLPNTVLGTSLPVDPGKHLLKAEDAKGRRWATEIDISAGSTREVEVGPLGDPPKASPAPQRTTTSAVVPALWISGGASLALSGASGIAALVSYRTFNSECVAARAYCASEQGRSAGTASRAWAWTSTITLGLGALLWIAIPFVPKRSVQAGLGTVHVTF
jgi:hypothetical protein